MYRKVSVQCPRYIYIWVREAKLIVLLVNSLMVES